MSAISHLTMLHSSETGPLRAWSLGPSSITDAVYMETLWLPAMRFAPDLKVDTQRGMVPASELTKADWLRVERTEMPDVFWPTTWPKHMGGDTTQAYYWFKYISQTRPVKLIDMMECPDHVAHWRKDYWTLSLRDAGLWFHKFVQLGSDCWWARVLETNIICANMVPLKGTWEAYGIQVAA